jgi:Reverse transcriptase (RNA-dependent DNA polymerase)
MDIQPPPPQNVVIPPIPPEPDAAFQHVLQYIIGLNTPPKRDRVTQRGGVTVVEDLLLVDMDSLLECLTENTSVMAKTRLKTLKLWAEEQHDINHHIDIRDFTEEVCREKQMKIAKAITKVKTSGSDSATGSKEKLHNFNGKRENWLNAKRDLTAYLNQILNEDGVPIYYVIHDPTEEQEYRNHNGDIGGKIYDAPFQGRIYNDDAFKVLQILRLWTSNGTAQTYVDQSNDVQEAWSSLLTIYEGHDARNANIQRARSIILKAVWTRNTPNYTFDDYCNKHVRENNELNRYHANVDGESQVRFFLDGIKCSDRNSTIPAMKVIIGQQPNTKADLLQAIIAFKDLLRTNPQGTEYNNNNRSIGSTYRTGGRGNNGGRGGRGGRGYNGRNNRGRGNGGRNNMNNNNNNNDKGIYIPPNVLSSVGPKFRAMLYKGRDVMEQETGNIHPTRQLNNEQRTTSQVEVLEDNDPQFIADNTTDDNIDINGSASSKFGATGRNNKKSRISAIISSIRRTSKFDTNSKQYRNYDLRARAEIDTRADTLCAGSTFILYESTGKVVDVTGFHDSFDAIKNIPVGTCITAIDLDGETIIASFPQSLYFGDSMETSLIPPAQLWDYGITVDVVPKQYSDGKSLHGIHHPTENIFIPFHLHGCISYFITRLPTDEEIEQCRWVTFTSDAEWQPYSDHFKDAERAAKNFHRYPDPTHLHYDQHGELLDGRYIKMVKTNIDDNVDPYLCTFDYTYNRFISATSSTVHRTNVPIEILARRWGTSLNTAERTLNQTTQRGLRYLQGPLDRRFRTRQKQLDCKYLKTNMYTDTMFKEKASARGNTCVQLFVTSEGFVAGQPMKSKADAHEVLDYVCRTYGVPQLLVSDNAKEETLGNWGRVIKHYLIRQRMTEPHSGWQNRCEDEIREVRKHYARIMALHKCPDAFWDFAIQYVIKLRQLLVRSAASNRSPIETITGETPDTSEYIEFDFYQWVKYREQTDKDDPIKLGRWLGIAHDVGSSLTYWILKPNGKIIARSTVRPLLPDEEKSETEKQLQRDFDKSIMDLYGSFDSGEIQIFDIDNVEEGPTNVNIKEDGDAHSNDGNDLDAHNEMHDDDHVTDTVRGPDLFVNAEVFLPHGDRNEIAKVIGRKRDNDGNYIGRKHNNPLLDSRIFTVRFPDGEEKDISYNILAEYLFSQVDSEGNQYRIFREIINHRKGKSALDKADQYRIASNGRRTMKHTTAGWDFEVEWKDGSTSWLPLKDLKETNAVEVAQYAKENRLMDEPAFAWWAPHVLKKLIRLIKMSRSKHVRKGYKFGIRIPTSVEEALELDKENNNTLWYDAIMKEMKNVRIAFEIVPTGEKPPPGYQFVGLMMVFDIKMDFTRKARLVARGDQTDTPLTLIYSSVVSRESVRIAFLIAALNDIDLMMFDVGNAYLNAATTEKLYTIAGKEFGPDEEGKLMIIRRALYGLKSSGAAYRAHFAATLTELNFVSCKADPDVWMRPATKDDGFQYYEYILTYVDDCLIVSHQPQVIIDILQGEYKYRLKDIGPPTRYLGAEIGKYQFADGNIAWYMSAQQYLKQAINEVENKWGPLNKLFGNRQLLDVPMQAGSHPELDTSKFLDDDKTQLYQSYIGVLRWAVELGRIDLAHVAGVMARFSAAPREGHMTEVLRIFAYTKKHIESKLVFDPMSRDFDDIEWTSHDWKTFYPDIEGEVLPLGRPHERGNPVQINLFCDAAHGTCHATRRSTTGIIIFINGSPITWYSKRQNTIESSVFGSEFVALKIAIEMNEALRYKLRMMGIPIDGPTNCFCDNKSVVTNATIPQSTLQKKHNMIAYHKVRESVASTAIRIQHELGKFNLSDCLTKFLRPHDFKRCIQCILMR